jgi:hypothetical protein
MAGATPTHVHTFRVTEHARQGPQSTHFYDRVDAGLVTCASLASECYLKARKE